MSAPPPTPTPSARQYGRCWAPNGPSSTPAKASLYAEASDELRQVAEFLQVPVMTTLEGKSAFPENHPLALGVGGSSTTGAVYRFLPQSDLVFAVGCSLVKSGFTTPIPPGKTIIHATNADVDINKDYKSHYPLVGDAKLVLNQMLEELRRQAGQPRPVDQALTSEIRSAKQEWMDQWMPLLTSDEVPLNPYRVIWDVMNTVDLDNTIVTHESGSPREQVTPFWEARAPRSFIGWGKSTQLGYSLGLAMGAKLAAPEKQVINFMGDAAFGMVGMDVETAVRENIPITTIVLNNSTMAIYPDHRMPVAVERYQTKNLSGNFAEVAQALGAYSEKITQPEDIIPAMQRAQEVNRSGARGTVGVHHQGGGGPVQVPVRVTPVGAGLRPAPTDALSHPAHGGPTEPPSPSFRRKPESRGGGAGTAPLGSVVSA